MIRRAGVLFLALGLGFGFGIGVARRTKAEASGWQKIADGLEYRRLNVAQTTAHVLRVDGKPMNPFNSLPKSVDSGIVFHLSL